MTALTDDQYEHLGSELRRLEAELSRQIEAATAGAQPVDLDQPIGRVSRIDAIQQQGMVAASRQNLMRRLRMVRSALEAVRTGSYGVCRQCEEPIGYGRLVARPEAPFCVQCQTELEARRR